MGGGNHGGKRVREWPTSTSLEATQAKAERGSPRRSSGYLANFVEPLAPYPWTYLTGLQTAISITDLFGNNAPFNSTQVVFENYSILSNTYTPTTSAELYYSSADSFFQATLNESLSKRPDAPSSLRGRSRVTSRS